MRLIFTLPLVAALALAGCGKADDKPKSEAEVKQAAAQLANPKPGMYRSTSKLVSFEVPGMAPAQSARLKEMFSTTQQGRDYCLTPEDAEKGFEAAMQKLPQGSCQYDRFNVSGAKLDAQMTCVTGKDMKALITLVGTVGEEGSQMRMSVNQSAPGGQVGGMKMVADVASQRTGDCTGVAK